MAGEQDGGNVIDFMNAYQARHPRIEQEPEAPTMLIYLAPNGAPRYECRGKAASYALALAIGCWMALGSLLRSIPWFDPHN
jgi:hypothetical protein